MKTNPSTIAIILLLFAAAAYLGGVAPMSKSLLKLRGQQTELESRLAEIEMGAGQHATLRERIAQLERQNGANRDTLITPVLNSYAMRVKSLVDTMATEAGMTDIEYAEENLLALPVPKGPLPTNRTARRAVRIKAMADYAAAISFLLRAERELPLMTLQSLSIRQPKVPRTQQQEVEIVLEWPGKGEVIK